MATEIRTALRTQLFFTRVFTRSYGAPNSAGRCSMAQYYDKTRATLVHKLNGPVLLIDSSSTECWEPKSSYMYK